MDECEFCQIIAGMAPAEVIADYPEALAFFPLRPAAVGHTLVVPKRHVRDIWEADAHTVSVVAEATRRLCQVALVTLSPDGINFINSAGAAATQTVPHLHVHVVPRWRNDEIGEIWPPSEPLDRKVRKELADQMRQAAASLKLGAPE